MLFSYCELGLLQRARMNVSVGTPFALFYSTLLQNPPALNQAISLLWLTPTP